MANIGTDEDFVWELEQEWKKSLPVFTERQWLTIFPEALQVFRKRIWDRIALNKKFYQDELKRQQTIINKKLSYPLKDHWAVDLAVETIDENLKEVTKEIKRDRWILTILKSATKKKISNSSIDKITPDDILRAKEIPITDFIQVNKSGIGLCPFHTEKHASFKVFKDNGWYCFGACGIGGDVIEFIKKLNKCDFIQAVKFLVKK